MAEEAEQKSLPASDKKLRDARRRGQVSHSRDLVAGVTLFAALVYLFIAWPLLLDHLFQIVDTVVAWPDRPFDETIARTFQHVFVVISITVGPMIAITVVLAVIAGMIATRGPVFSFEPVKPQFANINPAKGLKRIVSLRNVVEFAKALAKVVILACLFLFIFLAWLQPMFDAPACGRTCLESVVMAVLTPLGTAAALAFVFIGLIDIPIQRGLFLRDMRMTKREYKREKKDLDGDPLIRQERQRLRQQASTLPARLSLQNATFAATGNGRLIALSFVDGETPVPVIVSRAEGDKADALVAEARRLQIPVVEDANLANHLFETKRVGDFIGTESFQDVITYLLRFQKA